MHPAFPILLQVRFETIDRAQRATGGPVTTEKGPSLGGRVRSPSDALRALRGAKASTGRWHFGSTLHPLAVGGGYKSVAVAWLTVQSARRTNFITAANDYRPAIRRWRAKAKISREGTFGPCAAPPSTRLQSITDSARLKHAQHRPQGLPRAQ